MKHTWKTIALSMLLASSAWAQVKMSDLDTVSNQAKDMVQEVRQELKENIEKVQANIGTVRNSLSEQIKDTDVRINQAVTDRNNTV